MWDHAAVWVENNGDWILYDPAGSFGRKRHIRYNGTLEGQNADLHKYIAYHLSVGNDIDLYRFNTTTEQESEILSRINMLGEVSKGSCAHATSFVLNGIGPFKNLGSHILPSFLGWKLFNIPKASLIEIYQIPTIEYLGNMIEVMQ